MGLMTTLRERMTIVLWLLLFFFLLSMSIGGLVGGANIIDQIVGRVDPNRVIAQINGQDISPDYFNNLVNQQIDQARSSGQQVNDMMYERARSAAWDNLLQQVLVSAEIERLELEADAILAARNMDIDMAEAVMRVELGSKVSEMSSKELKRDLLVFARNNPDLLLELINDDNVQLRNYGIRATELGIIKLSKIIITRRHNPKKNVRYKTSFFIMIFSS